MMSDINGKGKCTQSRACRNGMGMVQWAGSLLNPGKESSAALLIALAENSVSQRIPTLTMNKRAQLT